jgi:hypothetical protein
VGSYVRWAHPGQRVRAAWAFRGVGPEGAMRLSPLLRRFPPRRPPLHHRFRRQAREASARQGVAHRLGAQPAVGRWEARPRLSEQRPAPLVRPSELELLGPGRALLPVSTQQAPAQPGPRLGQEAPPRGRWIGLSACAIFPRRVRGSRFGAACVARAGKSCQRRRALWPMDPGPCWRPGQHLGRPCGPDVANPLAGMRA